MPVTRLTISYDGAGFSGWAVQPGRRTVEGELGAALETLVKEPVKLAVAGRTDAGVHALGQVAGFPLERSIAPDALARALNARLPHAVRVMSAEEAPAEFNARFDVRTKTYRYRIWNKEAISPFERRYAWHLAGELDVDRMAAAARLVEGKHDFAAFQASGSSTKTTERVVISSHFERRRSDAPRIVYEISGEGFLRHMVRNIVGTLVEIGRRRRNVEWMADVLASRDRSKAGPTAPPEGLFLVRVVYN